MIQSGGRRLLLLGAPRMILSGATCLLGAPWPRHRFAAAPRPHAGLRLSASPPFLGFLGGRGVPVAGAPLLVACCSAPPRVPCLCGCGVRCPGLRHPAAAVAWRLVLCLSCGRRGASLGCLLDRAGAPRVVQSGRSRYSGRLSRRCGAFPHPGGCRPRLYPAAARGTRRPAENRAHCACRWPLPRQGRWAPSALYPFEAPPWVCPWQSLQLRSWAACAAVVLRVWTRSLTRPGSRTVRCATGDSAGAPGLFRVDADTFFFGSEDATPRSRARVRVPALRGQVGRARLPGAFRCASPFLWPFCPAALLGPLRAGVALVVFFFLSFLLFFLLFFFSSLPTPPLSPAFCALRPGLPLALALSFSSPPPPCPRIAVFFFAPLLFRSFFFVFVPPPAAPFLCFVFFCSCFLFRGFVLFFRGGGGRRGLRGLSLLLHAPLGVSAPAAVRPLVLLLCRSCAVFGALGCVALVPLGAVLLGGSRC